MSYPMLESANLKICFFKSKISENCFEKYLNKLSFKYSLIKQSKLIYILEIKNRIESLHYILEYLFKNNVLFYNLKIMTPIGNTHQPSKDYFFPLKLNKELYKHLKDKYYIIGNTKHYVIVCMKFSETLTDHTNNLYPTCTIKNPTNILYFTLDQSLTYVEHSYASYLKQLPEQYNTYQTYRALKNL